jgi:hypothetical protein
MDENDWTTIIKPIKRSLIQRIIPAPIRALFPKRIQALCISKELREINEAILRDAKGEADIANYSASTSCRIQDLEVERQIASLGRKP